MNIPHSAFRIPHFGSLPANLAAFCGFLRREHRFAIDPRQLRDAARAIDVVDVTDQRAVRDALRPVLASTFRDAAAFDGAFVQFFFPGPAGAPQAALPRPDRDIGGSTDSEKELERKRADRERERPDTSTPGALAAVAPAARTDASAPPTTVLGRYSPIEAEAQSLPELTPVDRAWRDAARVFVRRVQLGVARRWRPASSGQRFDLRRTLRASLHTGGEPLVVRWLRRRRQSPRFVVIVDGSRSMADAAATALDMTVAIASVSARVEAFTFSTGLQRITEQVRLAAAGQPLQLGPMQYAWGGGTAIGACLREFLRRFGDRLLGRDTTVIIASDGLDVGDVIVLRDAMREIRRRSAAVVWLNPLLDSAGYQPTASGMTMARPYVTTFASVCDPPALARLNVARRLQPSDQRTPARPALG